MNTPPLPKGPSAADEVVEFIALCFKAFLVAMAIAAFLLLTGIVAR